jgi:hypothetical protein
VPETPPRRNSNSVATEVCSIRVHPEPFPSQPTPPCSIATKNCPAKSVFDCSTQEYLRYFVRGDLRLIHIAALFDKRWVRHVKPHGNLFSLVIFYCHGNGMRTKDVFQRMFGD